MYVIESPGRRGHSTVVFEIVRIVLFLGHCEKYVTVPSDYPLRWEVFALSLVTKNARATS